MAPSAPSPSPSLASSPVVFVSIMPRAEPVTLTHPPAAELMKKPRCPSTTSSKNNNNNSGERALRRWDVVVCDVLAQMLLLPMVCVSVCGAVGLLLSLECMETLQRHAALRRLPFQSHRRLRSHDRRHGIAANGCNANRDQKEKEEGRRDDDAGARRPLKKQRASAGDGMDDRRSSATEASGDANSDRCATNCRDSSNPLETRPLVNKASAKLKKTVTRKRRVFIWDLDETLVLFASLYNGAFAQTHGKEVATGVQLGEQMMTFLLAMLERHFFFNDLHDADIDHIDCLRSGGAFAASVASDAAASPVSPASLAGLTARYSRIREIYERSGGEAAVDFLSDERSEWFAIRAALVGAIDAFSTGWLREARLVLELLTSTNRKASKAPEATASGGDGEAGAVEYENINLMVTNTQLAPALCKCLIYELDAFFPIESVYSSSKLHKQHCFEQIMRTYSSSSTNGGSDSGGVEFIAIGDGAEEEYVSRALGIQFHKIRSLADLKRLRFDLQLEVTAPAMS